VTEIPRVVGVSLARGHNFSKQPAFEIRLLTGLGVAGDAHVGEKVKHRSRVAKDPTQPNLRHVHLIQAELFDDLARGGFNVQLGDMGENIATRGVDLLGLPQATRLHVGSTAIIEVTGLRNPCVQIDRFQKGLMQAVLDRDIHGNVVRKAGIMAIVIQGGDVRAGDGIAIELPLGPLRPLSPV
jgi:MOSC domain-containing protein YiiM